MQEYNADVLYVFTTLNEKTLDSLTFNGDTATTTFAVKGEESGTVDLFEIAIKDNGGSYSAEIVKVWRDGDKKWTEIDDYDESANGYLPTVTVDEKQQLQIELDDITEQHQHFTERFPKMKPGEDVKLYFKNGEQVSPTTAVDEKEYTPSSCNSLFCEKDETNVTITHVRHLQNLDAMVSGVDTTVKKATLKNDLTLNTSVYPMIYSADSTKYMPAGYFYGLFNNHLTTFDGENHTLSNFSFRSPTDFTVGGVSGKYSGNAGLFRYVENGLTVKNLQLLDCKAMTESGHDGMVAAEVDASGSLTLDTVLVRDTPKEIPADEMQFSTEHIHVNSETGSAGGLVGSASGKITVNNCGASVYVTAGGSGNAGGLIGETLFNVIITNSFTGGRTEGGKYYNIDKKLSSSTDNTANWWNNHDDTTIINLKRWNISQTGSGAAGGLIGYCKGETHIAQSFNAASVFGTYAGGLIGRTDDAANVYLGDKSEIRIGTEEINGCVYTIAPVSENDTYPTYTGAVIGYKRGGLFGTNVYYLPQVDKHYNTANAILPIVGSGAADNFQVKEAYYDKDGTSEARILIEAKYEDASKYWTLEIGTVNYDKVLEGREYPYSIWTSLPFGGYQASTMTMSNGTNGTYFGDWQPILPLPSVTSTVEFWYINPTISPRTEKYIDEKPFLVGEYNSLVMPEIPRFYRYHTNEWRLYQESTYLGSCTLAGGQLQIPASMTKTAGEYRVVISYANDTTVNEDCSISFWYRPDGTAASYQQIGVTREYTSQKTWADVKNLVTPRTIADHWFVGWYQNPECTTPWTDTAKLSWGSKAYAKYEPLEYYYITVDFKYAIVDKDGNVTEEYLSSVPRYDFDAQNGQIRIKQPVGSVYDNTVPMPVCTGYWKIVTACAVDTEMDADTSIKAIANDKLHLTANKETHFVVTHFFEDNQVPAENPTVCHVRLENVLNKTTFSGGKYIYDDGNITVYPYRVDGKENYFHSLMDSAEKPIIPDIKLEQHEKYLLYHRNFQTKCKRRKFV